MVLPIIGALAGAGGSIAAALIGAGAQDQATQYNWMANIYNLRQREKERRESKQYADELRGEQKLGATDAQGNRTYFKEGVGWVTDLSDDQQALQDYFYKQELPARQSQFWRSEERSRDDADIAGSLINEFRRLYAESPAEVEAMLYEVASRGISEATQENTEAAMRQAARTGNSNIAAIMGKLGQSDMKARGDARLDSRIQARDYIDNKLPRQRSQLAELYNMFATRAGNPLGATFDPGNATGGANALMQAFAGLAQQGNSQGFAANQMRGGTLDYIQPNMAYANAAGAIGSSLSGLGERAGSYMDKQSNNALLRQYISGGGQIDMNSGGMFGLMTDRLAGNQGMF